MQSAAKKIVIGGLVLLATGAAAVVGYMMAGWTLLDAVYMVIITTFGVGYGEVRPIADPGLKVFTIILIVVGCSSLIYVTGGFIQMLTEGELKRALGSRQTAKEIGKLNGHVIVCGYGRVGRILSRELGEAGRSVVVADAGDKRVTEAEQSGLLAVKGDATEEKTLLEAGIERAAALATVLPNDALNVFITLTARELRPDIEIVARAESLSTEKKLLRSGATHVVLPSAIGAARIAELLTVSATVREALGEAFEEGLHGLGLSLSEVEIGAESPFVGDTVAKVRAACPGELMIPAVARAGQGWIRGPEDEMTLQSGDRLLALAPEARVEAIMRRLTGRAAKMYRGVSY